jgi:hypothetical protein
MNGERRRHHNEELHSLYRALNIVRMIKSRRLRWTVHVAEWKKVGVFQNFNRYTCRKVFWEGLGVDGRTILEYKRSRYQYDELVDLAQDRDYWRALVNAALNLRVP